MRGIRIAKILLIDDDVDFTEANRLVLTGLGHTVSCAATAAEAEALIGNSELDVIVLDVMMESMTAGFELATRIHRANTRVPVIMVSGIREMVNRQLGFEPGESLPVLKFVDKPVTPRALAAHIEAVIRASTSMESEDGKDDSTC